MLNVECALLDCKADTDTETLPQPPAAPGSTDLYLALTLDTTQPAAPGHQHPGDNYRNCVVTISPGILITRAGNEPS